MLWSVVKNVASCGQLPRFEYVQNEFLHTPPRRRKTKEKNKRPRKGKDWNANVDHCACLFTGAWAINCSLVHACSELTTACSRCADREQQHNKIPNKTNNRWWFISSQTWQIFNFLLVYFHLRKSWWVDWWWCARTCARQFETESSRRCIHKNK